MIGYMGGFKEAFPTLKCDNFCPEMIDEESCNVEADYTISNI